MWRVAGANFYLGPIRIHNFTRETVKPQQTIDPPEAMSSAPTSSRKRAQAYNTAGVVLDFAANVAEATEILSPLKAASKAMKSILDVFQVSGSKSHLLA